MDGQIRMVLAGTEAELRPLQAMRLLDARREAAGLHEKLGGDAAAERLIFAACIVAAGAYEDERPLFATGQAALEGLTVPELLEAAAEYGDAAAPDWLCAPIRTADAADAQAQIPDGSFKGGMAVPETPERRAAPQPAGEEPEAAAAGLPAAEEKADTEQPAPERERLQAPEMPAERRRAAQHGELQQTRVDRERTGSALPLPAGGRRQIRLDSGARRQEENEAEFAAERAPDRTGPDMQRVSSYFERDCRRYDGGFTCY